MKPFVFCTHGGDSATFIGTIQELHKKGIPLYGSYCRHCRSQWCWKTNVLDALYYLSFTKSYFSRPDAQNVHHAYQGLRIDGKYNINNNEVTISCIIRENLKKEFYFDEEMYPKHSQHLGKIPCVMITPDDVQIITGASEERRKLMDSLLCQIHPPI